jgi:hypothetical protein
MKTYIAQWPDNSLSILKADNEWDVFDRLDGEADPFAAKVYELKDDFHFGVEIQKNKLKINRCADGESPSVFKKVKFTEKTFAKVNFATA